MRSTSCPGCSRAIRYRNDELPLTVECAGCARLVVLGEDVPAPTASGPSLLLVAGAGALACAVILAVAWLASGGRGREGDAPRAGVPAQKARPRRPWTMESM